MNTNVLDLLLQADESKLIKPSKQVEITRLSNIFGEKVIFTCEAITARQYDKIQQDSINIDVKHKDADLDINNMQRLTVIEGVKEPNFKNKSLREKYKVPTPLEVLDIMLLPGEVTNLYNVIINLSGFGDDAVEEVKNSQGQMEKQN